MKQRRVTRTFEVTYNEQFDDNTKVLIIINLQTVKVGFSLDLLNEFIKGATDRMSTYKIYNTTEGLIVEGEY